MAYLYLVRHAKAGERRLWKGDDIDRPLSKKGWKQADLVAKRLAKYGPSTLLSSRYTRCVQTLEPLADRLDTSVEIDDRLTEYEPIDAAIELLREVDSLSVMCSHGDIIPGVVTTLAKHGTTLRTPIDWRKSGVWVLKRNKKGEIVHATVWPPPVV